VSIAAAVLTGIGALLTLAVARSRGRALAGLGISALLVGAAGWAAIELARRRINDALNHTTGDIRRIADVMVGEVESSLHEWLDLTLAAGGVLVVLGVLAAVLGTLRKP
jgi:drug/metabolite transporter (DMT)-like permease